MLIFLIIFGFLSPLFYQESGCEFEHRMFHTYIAFGIYGFVFLPLSGFREQIPLPLARYAQKENSP